MNALPLSVKGSGRWSGRNPPSQRMHRLVPKVNLPVAKAVQVSIESPSLELPQ
jgi:hypothetical protein